MGAGILPTAIYKNKLYFLFGRENQYEDSAPGFSDFGGGTDGSETYLQTAVREGSEELTGFLGNDRDLEKILKHGTYNIDYTQNDHKTYRMHIFPMKYDSLLPYYYNNNQRFLQGRLDPVVIKNSKIFEKAEIRWICIDDIIKMKHEFRSYFQNIIEMIYKQKNEINKFIANSAKHTLKKRHRKKGTEKRHRKK